MKNDATKNPLDEAAVNYTFDRLQEALLCMYDQMGEEEQHAFDLGEMFGQIKAVRKEIGGR